MTPENSRNNLPYAFWFVSAVVGGLLLTALLVKLAGYPAGPALREMVKGAVGGWGALARTLAYATPLLITGLAVAVAFRAGVWNIGAEGQMLMGSAVTTFVALRVGGVALPLACGSVAGMLWAAGPGALRAWMRTQEVITTIMFNFIALYAVKYAVREPALLQKALEPDPISPVIGPASRLPRLIDGEPLHVGLFVALACAGALWWYLNRTTWGFRLRTVGMNARAAKTAGMNVPRVQFGAMLLSGALAGLAGSMEILGTQYQQHDPHPLNPGFGYTAIAIAMLGRLHPFGILAAAVFFGALEAGAQRMGTEAGVPQVVVRMVEGLLLLLFLAADRIRSERST